MRSFYIVSSLLSVNYIINAKRIGLSIDKKNKKIYIEIYAKSSIFKTTELIGSFTRIYRYVTTNYDNSCYR